MTETDRLTMQPGAKADATRDRILREAARLFRDQGYAAVSLRGLAAAAGMKAGSLYYHFGSKEEIVAEILDAGILAVDAAVRAALGDLPADAPAARRLRAAIRAHLFALLEHSDFTSANVRIFGQVPEAVQVANRPARRRYEALWDGLLADLQARGELRPDADLHAFRLLLIGALNATLEWFDPARGGVDALAGHYADILLNGLLAETRP